MVFKISESADSHICQLTKVEKKNKFARQRQKWKKYEQIEHALLLKSPRIKRMFLKMQNLLAY